MQCAEFKSQLEMLGEARPRSAALTSHLQRCAECREFAEDLKLQGLLRTLPLREAKADFETRVLAAALASQPATAPQSAEASEKPNFAWMAVAASLVLAVLVGLQWQHSPNAVEPQELAAGPLQVEVGQLEPVQVLLNSDKLLQNVTLTVNLPPHLVLEGYADSQRLQWSSNLNPGSNKLVLPVQFRQDVIGGMSSSEIANSEITIELEHEGLRKQFRVPVQHALRSGAGDQLIHTS